MTRAQAEALAINLGCCTWDQGSDGFGGEWVAHEKAVKTLMNIELATKATPASTEEAR